ncbi:hypothetical protein KVV02_001989 [Mortierella alpina]|uniref:Uncharacterized protein n=1 Tax=Mortierella alpina TaxID=64518 RepID=A0A9P8CXC1_MORAP|nr:hypothetical protein KVV02_001989 [Mortierella alpina]
MASAGGLSRRRAAAASDSSYTLSSSGPLSAGGGHSNTDAKIASDPRDLQMEDENKTQPRLTLMEEVLLLGLKDKQGYLSFWNDNISYALRGCILMELAFRNRIAMVKDPNRRKYPLADRYIEVVSEKLTGEVLLDEALKMIGSTEERMSVGQWIDLMSGETWNVMKIGFQLKQVRERLAKGLVDKGVLRTEKRNFLIFDMATHPVTDSAVKEEVVKRACTALITRSTGSSPTLAEQNSPVVYQQLRTVAMVCAAYAANVLENALMYLNHEMRERAYTKVDELLSDYSQFPFGSGASKDELVGKDLQMEIVAAVLNVFTKMDTGARPGAMPRQQRQQPAGSSIAKGPLASSRLQQPAANSTSDFLPTPQGLGSSEQSRRQGGPCSTLTSLSSIPAPTSSPAAARIPRTNNAPIARRVKSRLRPTFSSIGHLFEKKLSDSGDEAEKKAELDAEQDADGDATKQDPPSESQEPHSSKLQQTQMETDATAESSGKILSTRSSQGMDLNPTAAEDAHTSQVHSEDADALEEQQEQSTAADVSFRAIYPYPDNKNAVIWSSRDPKTARTTTMTMLDTRASTGSNSIMSQARRISDQKLWQRQMDIKRDLGVTKSDQTTAVASQHPETSPTPSHRRRSSQDNQSRDGTLGEVEDLPRASSFRKSTVRNSSLRLSFRDSASPTPSEDCAPSGNPSNTAVKKSIGVEKEDAGKRSLSRKRVQRVLSSSIFTPGPRGTAPTPSPDVSVQLVHGPRLRVSTSNELYFTQGLTKQEREQTKRMERYEAQLDERLQMIQTNNRRLEELKSLWKDNGIDGVLALQDRGYEESASADDDDDGDNDDEDDEDDDWWMEQDRLRREEIFRFFQEQQQGRQSDLEAELEEQRAANQEMEQRMSVMSDQLQRLVEVGESQSRELEMARQQAMKDREQLERQLSDERLKHRQLQEAMDGALSRKENHTVAEVAGRQAAEQEEYQKLVAEIESLKYQVQELEQGIEDKDAEVKKMLAKHMEENQQSQSRIQRLEDEHRHQNIEQGALIESVERKEDRIHELKELLEVRTHLLLRRGDDMNVAHKEIMSLERQLKELHEDRQQDHDQFIKLGRESEVLRKELAQEKDMNRQQQKRIEILLEAQQETSQVQESKIQELEEELDRRVLEHSKNNSTFSSVAATAQAHASTIKDLQVQIEDQERILQEKEDRIQDLEQGLATAKQQDHRAIAYLEQDVEELRSECAKMAELLDEERLKAEALQNQLQQRDEDLHDELKQHLEADEQMLREVLSVLQSVESAEEVHGSELYSRLKEGVRDLRASHDDLLKQCSHQERMIEEQRDLLDDCHADLDAQREQFHQALEDLASASDEQRELRRQLQETEAKVKKAGLNANIKKAGAEPSNLNKTMIESLRSQVQSLEEELLSLEQVKKRMADQLAQAQEQIQSMDGTIQDQIVAAKSVREKYIERVQSLQNEVRKHRQVLVSQEGTMFLYLSVIEKLKLEIRGTKVE